MPISRRPASGDRKGPLFRSAAGAPARSPANAMNRVDAWRMIQRRAAANSAAYHRQSATTRFAPRASRPISTMAARWRTRRLWPHMKVPRTTKLYDRTGDEITLDEVERITI